MLFSTSVLAQVSAARLPTPVPHASAKAPEIQSHSFKEFKDVGQIWTIGSTHFRQNRGEDKSYLKEPQVCLNFLLKMVEGP